MTSDDLCTYATITPVLCLLLMSTWKAYNTDALPTFLASFANGFQTHLLILTANAFAMGPRNDLFEEEINRQI